MSKFAFYGKKLSIQWVSIYAYDWKFKFDFKLSDFSLKELKLNRLRTGKDPLFFFQLKICDLYWTPFSFIECILN